MVMSTIQTQEEIIKADPKIGQLLKMMYEIERTNPTVKQREKFLDYMENFVKEVPKCKAIFEPFMIREEYITQKNFKTHKEKFDTEAKIKIVGQIKVSEFDQVVTAFNKVPQKMKERIEILKINSSHSRSVANGGQWVEETKTMTLTTHRAYDQEIYDNHAFHESAHSIYSTRTEDQLKEWSEKVKGLYYATSYSYQHYNRWQKEAENLRQWQFKKEVWEKKPDAQNLYKLACENVEIIEKNVEGWKGLYFNELHSEAYARKYANYGDFAPVGTIKASHHIPAHRSKLIKFYEAIFEGQTGGI